MIVYPAIDIIDGKVVRLHQGRFDEVTSYGDDPVSAAQAWVNQGAQWIHVVDLDGAKTGESKNIDTVIRIAKSVNVPVQTGGGIRSLATIEKLIAGGLSRVILGTRAIEDREFLKDVVSQYKEKIAISLDCHDGFVAQRGWTASTKIKATDLVKELEVFGVRCVIYTDIARDGTLKGPNIVGLTQMLKACSISLIASGGVSCLDDIKQLIALNNPQLIGVITGKALYEGKLDLKEAIAIATGK